MNRTNPARLLGVLILCLLANGCATKVGVTLPKTALQRTIVYNYAASEANLAVGRAVRDTQAVGALTVAQATPVVSATVKVATMSDSIKAITSQSTEAGWSIDGPKIRKIIADAQVKVPETANAAVDLLVSTLNAALTLLTQGAN